MRAAAAALCAVAYPAPNRWESIAARVGYAPLPLALCCPAPEPAATADFSLSFGYVGATVGAVEGRPWTS
eukprot:gene4945-31026_t